MIFICNEKYYVYNILSTSLIEINKEVADWLSNGSTDKNLLDDQQVNTFVENSILVEPDFNETDAYLFYYDLYRLSIRQKALNLILVPTYLCNLSCTYCSQGKKQYKDNNVILTPKDVPRIINFINKLIDNNNNNLKKISVDFYGGEPLLAKSFCIEMMNSLFKLSEERNISVYPSLTTNSTLIDQELIDVFIKPFEIYVSITIDGLEYQHNIKRKRPDGKGTFNETVKCLEMLNNSGLKDKIVLRAHIDNDNINDAEEILYYFKDMVGDFYFAYLQHYPRINDEFASLYMTTECTLKYDFFLDSLIKKYGFTPKSSFGKRKPCSLCTVNSFAIDCFFNIYSCILLAKNTNLSIGKISNEGDFIIYPRYYSIMSRTPIRFEKCLNCITMPVCASGCGAKAYYKNGDLFTPYCET
ncbi:MAG TPA: radical SAM protein, partial [Methanofastidiosum sp.]|nr:radical SAM protein [Methanofastidiosum sp.]